MRKFFALILVGALLITSATVDAVDVPKPFTPVSATAKGFQCLGRKTEFGNFLLPTQIRAADEPLLAAPIRLVAEPDLLTSAKGRAKLVEKKDGSARWEWNGESADFQINWWFIYNVFFY